MSMIGNYIRLPELDLARFIADPEAVQDNEIYPSGWEGGDMEREYVIEQFKRLKAFLEEARIDKQSVILYLS